MRRLPFPLAVAIPLLAATMVAGIGIPFGLLFLEMDERFSPNAALATALTITVLIMLGAVGLSLRAAKESPASRLPEHSSGRPQREGMVETTGQPWDKGVEDDADRARRKGSRTSERRRPR